MYAWPQIIKKRANPLNFSCWESSENIGTGRQKSFCPVGERRQTLKTHLPPVSPFRGYLCGSVLGAFVSIAHRGADGQYGKEDSDGDPASRWPSDWAGTLVVDSELFFTAKWVSAASSGGLRCTSSCSHGFAGGQGFLKGWKSKPSQGPALGWHWRWKRSLALRGWAAEHCVSRNRQDFTIPPAPPTPVLLYLLVAGEAGVLHCFSSAL